MHSSTKTLAWIALFLLCGIHGCCGMQYNYFDDYLSNFEKEQNENELIEGSASEPILDLEIPKYKLPLRTGLLGSKDETCCSLGYMAGDKGYHCVAKFYHARIILRNQNRAHNRKLGFHGHDSVTRYGAHLMPALEQCVAKRGGVFHKCCREAARLRAAPPHFDNVQRRRYEQKMRRIRIPYDTRPIWGRQ